MGTDEDKPKEIRKLINATFVRMICHERGIKVSEDALKEMANSYHHILLSAIEDVKERGGKVILRRDIERLVGE